MMALRAISIVMVGLALTCILSRRRTAARRPTSKRSDESAADAPLPPPTTILVEPDDLRGIRVVAFDAFGTLVRITDRRNLWREIGQRANRRVDARCVPGTLEEHVAACGVRWEPRWAAELEAELQSIELFADTLEALAELREAGYRLAVVSNLATPYVQPLRTALGSRFDAEIYSCEVGAAKPQPAIYAALCAALDIAPREILMVGDRHVSDVEGAQRFGIRALHVVRGGDTALANSISSPRDVSRLLPGRTSEQP
ncbi:HAD family hydrolase [Frigidibacter mobilis]|uniref:HAD superfamily hydrolase n=1 Tax=Frigidibacter mobilis TaxID=1335048 RepID=A0A159Z2I7_9RHOB|nr:HAD family hydrolase [Frigidibacter mobilis]AMY68314.1 HAD superfamily hydrolase [Frigidibacter mobilis]